MTRVNKKTLLELLEEKYGFDKSIRSVYNRDYWVEQLGLEKAIEQDRFIRTMDDEKCNSVASIIKLWSIDPDSDSWWYQPLAEELSVQWAYEKLAQYCRLRMHDMDELDRRLQAGTIKLSHIIAVLQWEYDADATDEDPTNLEGRYKRLLKLISSTCGKLDALVYLESLTMKRGTVGLNPGAREWILQHWSELIPGPECNCSHVEIADRLFADYGIRVSPKTVGDWRDTVEAFVYNPVSEESDGN